MSGFTIVILCLSIALQLAAAVLAYRLIPASRAGGAVWRLLAIAILLMTVRRVVTLLGLYAPEVEDLVKGAIAEVIALLISALMLGAVILAPRVFRTLERSLAAEQRSAEEAREAVRAREEFLSVASHELRTPLTSLKLASESLAISVSNAELPERTGKAIAAIGRQVARTEALVDRLLSVTRIQGGQLDLHRETIDLAKLVRDVAERFADDARIAACELIVEAESPVACDVDRSGFEQVVTNLISNALKFGAGKPITLRVARDGETAMLQVEDHGIGVAPDRAPRIFKRFERAVSAQEYGGLGLGLYIAHGIVEAHGGTIEVTSAAPGEGACFTLRVPCRQPPTPSPS